MEQPQGHAGIPIPIPTPTPTYSSPVSDHDLDPDEDHPDISPVGSPDLTESDNPPPPDQPHSSALSDDLRLKIIKQATIPIGVIASFRKMKKLTRDTSVIVAALKESALLVVSSNGKRVKRLHPLPLAEVKDPMVCTVLVENLPEDHSLEIFVECLVKLESKHCAFFLVCVCVYAVTMFSSCLIIFLLLNASIKNITIRDPHDARGPKKCTVAEKLISGKLHALVEYDSVEAAEKAVATLNNEQDWRYGLRVKLLKKLGRRKKMWRESEPEKCSTVQTSEPVGNEENHYTSEQHDDSHEEEDVDHLSRKENGVLLPKEKNGHRGGNRGRGRRQKYHSSNGHGHGTQYSSHGIEPSKPPPGPRMPDGTRGFTLGRGRPLATS
ncbi:UNVERIFIED_CONTAM: La-related protein 6A [Sesamum calycinum]|uniref:La-related protein 6A n=1 Tax=Sesamum calycinum TaxID=2727403 RepID=A0AAW2Q6P3_9LAMI